MDFSTAARVCVGERKLEQISILFHKATANWPPCRLNDQSHQLHMKANPPHYKLWNETRKPILNKHPSKLVVKIFFFFLGITIYRYKIVWFVFNIQDIRLPPFPCQVDKNYKYTGKYMMLT